MIDWLLSNSVTGSVTWIGTILGLVGLTLTYIQAKRAKDFAIQTKHAIYNLEGRLNASNLGFASSQLEVLIRLANTTNIDAAQSVFLGVKRVTADLFEYLLIRNKFQEEIIIAKRNISAIDKQLDLLALEDVSYNPGVLVKSVRGLSNFILKRESEIRHESVSLEEAR